MELYMYLCKDASLHNGCSDFNQTGLTDGKLTSACLSLSSSERFLIEILGDSIRVPM